jgi:endonuclease I
MNLNTNVFYNEDCISGLAKIKESAVDLVIADPTNPNKIILVYSRTSVSSTWDAGSTWNREHVYPQSLMNVSTDNASRHKGADYHNIKPENPSVNTSRGNKYFAETTTTTSYAPPAVVRGDVARILFYMVTMWPELSLVDAFETNRNEVIYSKQGNRNPYIYHQEFVCRVWVNTNTSTQQHCAA